ncbi:MAG: hypothetical protein QOG23_2679 [Blastocatellia bacterium]|jgi:hypothetical protein|nr:hypothetical protein [Blastocatellia bacterium]
MSRVELLKVFLASPSDVEQERQMVKEVLDAVNRTMGHEKNIHFEIIGWDSDSYPAYGKDAQAIINEQIADMKQFDLFVGMMWNSFGSPTPRSGSGTEEEFRRAVDSLKSSGRPEIMFYFNQQSSNFESAGAAEQKLKVLTFKEEIQKDGLTFDYDGPEDFRSRFQLHIEKWLIQHGPTVLTAPHVESTPESSTNERSIPKVDSVSEVISNSGMWILLKSQFSEAIEVSESGDQKILLKIPVSEASEDAFFRSLQPSQYVRHELLPFAHQNVGAFAKVLEAKRTSKENAAVWELTLELDEENSGFGSDMAYGNTSADELATMRARHILLNEEPTRPGRRGQNNQLEDGFFGAFVQGINTRVIVQGSVFPALWKELRGNVATFLPVARLWSVFHLITSNTCQYILDLKLGPIRNGVLQVYFRGQRRKECTNRDPYIIEFKGICSLD